MRLMGHGGIGVGGAQVEKKRSKLSCGQQAVETPTPPQLQSPVGIHASSASSHQAAYSAKYRKKGNASASRITRRTRKRQCLTAPRPTILRRFIGIDSYARTLVLLIIAASAPRATAPQPEGIRPTEAAAY